MKSEILTVKMEMLFIPVDMTDDISMPSAVSLSLSSINELFAPFPIRFQTRYNTEKYRVVLSMKISNEGGRRPTESQSDHRVRSSMRS